MRRGELKRRRENRNALPESLRSDHLRSDHPRSRHDLVRLTTNAHRLYRQAQSYLCIACLLAMAHKAVHLSRQSVPNAMGKLLATDEHVERE